MLFGKNYYNILLAFFCLILFYLIFRWIDYLSIQKYIVECFTTNEYLLNKGYSHTVDLPINTTYSCKNFCSPTARCAITGEQCFTDIDCPGCQPYSPPLPRSKGCVPGDNDAGKLTVGVTPQYSPLTSGYGTYETILTNNVNEKPAQANFGINTWKASFSEGEKLFNARYKPSGLQFMENYPEQYTTTGEFLTDGPLPSNAYL